ncbi:MAG TPA: NlpC/P60 family protein [Chthoniobacterales bacterium]|nr:NlpC/P60 family protein [Chthoniobacterales bacterium]
MKINGRLLVVIVLAMSFASVRGQEEKETLGDKLKKLFTRPTPSATPTPRRSHRRRSPSPDSSSYSTETPSPTESPAAIPSYGETPLPSSTPGTSTETVEPMQAESPRTQYFEPVRPINPGPRGRATPRMIYAPQTLTTPALSETATETPDVTEEESERSRPMPSLPQSIPNAQTEESPKMTPSVFSPTPAVAVSPTPLAKKTPSVAISLEDIAEAPQSSADIRKLIRTGLDLATRNLTYKYASADPTNGGLDCSGFIYYVLTKSGLNNVPRDARDQYVWVRKAGNFQAVLGHGDDTFELDGLRPGDLLFWANPSGASREAEITQIMIYIGRDKSTNQRLMIGASEHGTYNAQKKSDVGVFDFKPGSEESGSDEEQGSVFVGYGRFPDLSGN